MIPSEHKIYSSHQSDALVSILVVRSSDLFEVKTLRSMFLFHQYSLSDVSLRQVRSELVQMIKCDRDYWNWKICKM